MRGVEERLLRLQHDAAPWGTMYEEEHGRPDCFTTVMVPVPRRIDEEDFEGCLHPLEHDPSSSVYTAGLYLWRRRWRWLGRKLYGR